MNDIFSRISMELKGDFLSTDDIVKERLPECVEQPEDEKEVSYTSGAVCISYDNELGTWMKFYLCKNFDNNLDEIEIGDLCLCLDECKMMRDFLTCVIRRMEER